MQSTPNNKLHDGRDGLEIHKKPMASSMPGRPYQQSGHGEQHHPDPKATSVNEKDDRGNKKHGSHSRY